MGPEGGGRAKGGLLLLLLFLLPSSATPSESPAFALCYDSDATRIAQVAKPTRCAQ